MAADPSSTRPRILDAAARLFRQRGFHATTTRAISEIVGILSGSLINALKAAYVSVANYIGMTFRSIDEI